MGKWIWRLMVGMIAPSDFRDCRHWKLTEEVAWLVYGLLNIMTENNLIVSD